jgi:ABC-2 type transport system permease protein
MLKVLIIGLKDLTLAFRDRAALILMLAAPFMLTLGLGFVTGRFSGGSSQGLSEIPVVIVNQDGGQLGGALVDVFKSEDLAQLIEPQALTDLAEARRQVDDDKAAAVVIIPAGFTDSILPREGATQLGDPVKIEVYANPSRPTSAGVVQSILEEFVSRLEVGRIGGQVAVTQLITNGLVNPQETATVGRAIGERQANDPANNALIRLKRTTLSGDEPAQFDVLAYLAPAMALMFLMYTVSNGGRSILAERAGGTLPRLQVSPTTNTQVLGGKLLGIFLTGVAQVGILILASALLFGVKWGDPLAVALLIVAAAAGATGWGSLLAALAKTPAQVMSVGSALMLIFAIIGGSFGNNIPLPDWLQFVAKITPNAWGIQGFSALGNGGSLGDVTTNIVALFGMAAVLFTAAVVLFRRQGFAQK